MTAATVLVTENNNTITVNETGQVIEAVEEVVNLVSVAEQGPQGTPGVGFPTGGNTGQVLTKRSPADYDTQWANPGGGGGPSVPQGSFSIIS